MSGPVALRKAHANLGASKAHRWMACPGSVALEAEFPEESSPYALEGTAAHELAERIIRARVGETEGPQTAYQLIGEKIEVEAAAGQRVPIEVTEEMADAVDRYADYCEALARGASAFWVEHKFSLDSLGAPAPMFGTSDFVAYLPEEFTLEVVDLKYGKGKRVLAENNQQGLYYALGAALSLQATIPARIDKVRVTIWQPRISEAPSQWEVGLLDLIEWSGDLLAAAAQTLRTDAPLQVGDHCTFCRAQASCPAQRAHMLSTVQAEFTEIREGQLPGVELLDGPALAELLPKLDVVEDWIKRVFRFAQEQAEAGLVIPGYKLVDKRATRKWRNETDASAVLVSRKLVTEEQLYKKEMLSVAQVEKVVGKRAFSAVEGLIVTRESSGRTLVPETDKRPATSAADEFTAIPAGGLEELL